VSQVQAPQVVIAGAAQPLADANPIIAAYNLEGHGLIPAVTPDNENMKDMVGNFIYEHIQKIVGDALVGKITGMILDLPLEEIKRVLYNYNYLLHKVKDAYSLLMSQMQQQQQIPQ